jgi:hypothetical protein
MNLHPGALFCNTPRLAAVSLYEMLQIAPVVSGDETIDALPRNRVPIIALRQIPTYCNDEETTLEGLVRGR